MGLASDFETFCGDIVLDCKDEMEKSTGEIAKKLNKTYYDVTNDCESHIYIVGSVGRGTAKSKTSDLDIIFDLPKSVYTKYDNYSDNGQSKLLQEVKTVLKERYPKTDIRGDGQVVVIEFDKYTVELVPAFKQTDNKFKYPDTHDGGSWKLTDPLSEQTEAEATELCSLNKFRDFCRLLRCWKNMCGVVMGGLLIDSLTYNHFLNNEYFASKSYDDYFDIFLGLFEYFKGLNKEQVYWSALGSHQHIYNVDEGSFIDKAAETYNKLSSSENDNDRYSVLKEILGNSFAPDVVIETSAKNEEQFIEDVCPVNITYALKIDCVVSQNGFRDFMLRKALRYEHHILRHNKSLLFKIVSCSVPEPYNIYWKVRNVGYEAEKRNMVRGTIIMSNRKTQKEHTDFWGPHFVECFIIKNGVCVARDRIDVPIGHC